MIQSGIYRNTIKDYVDGDSGTGEDLLCTSFANGTVWDEYGFDTAPDRISMYSSSNPYFSTSGDVTKCTSNFSFAQCMGAPCWDTTYDGIWNTTCICPYKTESCGSIMDTREDDDDVCDDVTDDSDCAAVGFGSCDLEYALDGLEAMVAAVETANLTINTDECPCEWTDDDWEA